MVEITALVQALLWFREYRRQHLQAPDRLCILYDSWNAFQAISCDVPPALGVVRVIIVQIGIGVIAPTDLYLG
eukprot:COSAG01_NODE_30305_length_618_cov_2.344894_2_plen_73_part_00